jgi:uncharacterized membrane protein YgcG
MKKIISIIVAVCISTVLSVTAFAEGHVFLADNADFFTNSEEDKLFDKMNDIAEESDWCIMILTESGSYTESEARSELKQWYKDEFGSSEKGAAYIMTSETGQGEGNNDYALVIETFGGATVSENRTYNQAEDAFLDYDEYGSAVAFLSACGKTSTTASKASDTSSSSSDEKTSPIVYIITFVIVGGALAIGVIKRILVRKALGSVGLNTNSYNRRDRYRNRNYGSSNRSSGVSRSSSRKSSGGRTGRR